MSRSLRSTVFNMSKSKGFPGKPDVSAISGRVVTHTAFDAAEVLGANELVNQIEARGRLVLHRKFCRLSQRLSASREERLDQRRATRRADGLGTLSVGGGLYDVGFGISLRPSVRMGSCRPSFPRGWGYNVPTGRPGSRRFC